MNPTYKFPIPDGQNPNIVMILKKKIAISYYYDDYYTEVLSRLIQFTSHDNI